MNPIERLRSVLCDPEGKCCIHGSDEDRRIVDEALRDMAEAWRAHREAGGQIIVNERMVEAAYAAYTSKPYTDVRSCLTVALVAALNEAKSAPTGDPEHLAPESDPKAHRRCKCEFSSGGVQSKTCAFHERQLRASAPTGDTVQVPREPTQVMCQAGQEKAREWPKFPLRISPIYRAMLAAAPSAQKGESQGGSGDASERHDG